MMKFADHLRFAYVNLFRNRFRSLLTLVGITIGVAGLYAFMSFGTALQRISKSEFHAFDEFHAVHVTSYPKPVNPFSVFSFQEMEADSSATPIIPITDELLDRIRQIPGVAFAFPDEYFLIQIRINNRVFTTDCQPIPMDFANLPRYKPVAGSFFTSPADTAMLISEEMARQFGFNDPKSTVGETIEFSVPVLRVSGFRFGFYSMKGGVRNLPFVNERFDVVIRGVLPDEEQSLSGSSRISIPIDLFRDVPKFTEDALFGLLLQQSNTTGYPKIQVHLSQDADPGPVYHTIEGYGLHVTKYGDQFANEQRTLALLDATVLILGTIALFVAAIGMSNTMIVNVVERTREIGVIKAVGGEVVDVQRLFLVECGLMGLLGALSGLALGWVVKTLISIAADYYFNLQGRTPFDLFDSSFGMVAGIVVFTIVITVFAGFIPARRAARIEPIEALRS